MMPDTTAGRPILMRYAYLTTCTLGRLELDDLTFETIERPWERNPEGPGGLHDVSCVPDGLYKLEPHDSPAHPNTLVLVAPALGVYAEALPHDPTLNGQQRWGRVACLIHPGNSVSDVNGCIAPGLRMALRDEEFWVFDSRRAFEQLRPLLLRWGELEIRATTGTV